MSMCLKRAALVFSAAFSAAAVLAACAGPPGTTSPPGGAVGPSRPNAKHAVFAVHPETNDRGIGATAISKNAIYDSVVTHHDFKVSSNIAAGCVVAGCSNGIGELGVPANDLRSATSRPQYLYVANSYNGSSSVAVFVTGQTAPVRVITKGVVAPEHLAFDPAGRLYVGNHNSVSIYKPGGTRPIRTITDGASAPSALAFDSTGRLYVSDFGGSGMVSVYKPGASQPELTITDGINMPQAIAIDATGNLYVANGANTVTAYKAGATSPFRTLRRHLYDPVALAFDAAGNLYVANHGDATSIIPRSRSTRRQAEFRRG